MKSFRNRVLGELRQDQVNEWIMGCVKCPGRLPFRRASLEKRSANRFGHFNGLRGETKLHMGGSTRTRTTTSKMTTTKTVT